MPYLNDEQIKTMAPVLLLTAFFNIAGWWLFPKLMILIIPVTLVVLNAIGEYLNNSGE